MKKLMLNIFFIVSLFLILTNCGKDENEEIVKNRELLPAVVKYYVYTDNIYDYYLLLCYSKKEGFQFDTARNVPWSYEMDSIDFGTTLYFSITSIPLIDTIKPLPKTYIKIFVNNKIAFSDTGSYSTSAYFSLNDSSLFIAK